MNEQEKKKILNSWLVIILALWLFWPLGVFLLVRRLSVDPNRLKLIALLLNIFAIASYVCAAFMLSFVGICLFDMSDPSNADVFPIFLIGMILCAVAGFFSKRYAKKFKKEAEDTNRYLSIFERENESRIDVIAALVDKPMDVVKSDIEKIIQKGYLKNAYIDERTNEVIYLSPAEEQMEFNVLRASSNERKPKVVNCSCCGANNTIIGGMGECEYCGSPLKE